MRRKIYIAGPMRGIKYYNFPKFFEIEEKLKKDGWEVMNPAQMDIDDVGFDAMKLQVDYDWNSIPEEFELNSCVKRDIEAVLKCNAIYMLAGWEKSSGARAEHAVAQFAMKDVRYETEGIVLTAEQRKQHPVFSGVINYFPDALMAVANNSYWGNEQHNPNTPLHWDRSKSGDELDACARHLIKAGTLDTDGIRHSSKLAWRALANLQKELEKDKAVFK